MTAITQARKPKKQATSSGDLAVTYNQFKEFEGRRYTGMKIGRSHKWYYDKGEWKEKKITPDEWEINYAVKKRRAGKAPEGSGAPVGTAYRWYILAHQIVTKLDANSYTTELAGLKYKLAHRRADKTSWSASENAQRKRLVEILKEMIADLEKPAEVTAAPVAKAQAAASMPQRKPRVRKAATARKTPRPRHLAA